MVSAVAPRRTGTGDDDNNDETADDAADNDDDDGDDHQYHHYLHHHHRNDSYYAELFSMLLMREQDVNSHVSYGSDNDSSHGLGHWF